MSESEFKILCGSKKIIIFFGGLDLAMGRVPPFEFLTYFSKNNSFLADLYFYIDKEQAWYHKGIEGISKNIEESVSYLKNVINIGSYEEVIFLGISAGGYAAILFGSLCGADYVLSFMPQTKVPWATDSKYKNLKDFINSPTKYILYGDPEEKGLYHAISHCTNLEPFSNVEVRKIPSFNMRSFVYSGNLKTLLESL